MIENPPQLKASRLGPAASSQSPVASDQRPEARSRLPETRLRPAQPSCNRPFIIPVFLPHAGCPHRCVFCNQSTITATHSRPASNDVRRQIETFLGFRHKKGRYTQVAFFGGNFLGIQTRTIRRLLTVATEYVTAGQADSIRFSTRPDTVNPQRLAAIKAFPITTVELGVQSMDDRVLERSNRGHTAADTVKAVQLLREHKYEVGVQMMVGLPGDDVQRLRASARRIARLKPDFMRIYPTVVLAGSPLATGYQKGDYVPLSLAEAVRQVKDLYLYFKNKSIAVIRMGLQATEAFTDAATLLAGPYHPAFGHMVHSEIFLDMAVAQLDSLNSTGKIIRLHVHPRSVSKMRGTENRNIQTLCEKFDLQSIEIIPDTGLDDDQLTVTVRP
ncbi:MAG: radical SAM protein [Desulfobacterales bacterium]|jgi:histone acetyltransferase (RNA polymerase elongator complex component)